MKIDNNDIVRIGKSIRHQSELERQNRGQQQIAIARFDVDMILPNGKHLTHLWLSSKPYQPTHTPIRDIVGNFRGTTGSGVYANKEEGSQYFNKNSAVGVLLTSRPFGTYTYRVPQGGKSSVERQISFSSKATYRSTQPIKDLVIHLDGQNPIRYASINDLLQRIDLIEKEIEKKRREQKRLEEEQKRIEEEKKEQEQQIANSKREEAERIRKENERLENERKLQEEKRRVEEEEIKKLEEEKLQALKNIEQTHASILTGREMLYQEIIDESQMQAKISHLYDGIPIVIDGGPGTGKTTTSIARLKFLIDPFLKEHEQCNLTESQIQKLTDASTVNSHWIFLSPSDLLAQYLKSALSAEGLSNDTRNVIPYDRFLANNLREYQITKSKSEKKPSFKVLKNDDPLSASKLISDGKKVVADFQTYIIEQLSKPFKKAIAIQSNGFEWHKCASDIQSYCTRIENVKTLSDLASLLSILHEAEKENVKIFADKLRFETEVLANRIRKVIMSNEDMVGYLSILFEEWDKEKNAGENDEVELIEEEETNVNIGNMDNRVYQNLKPLLRRLALKQFDSSISLSKRQQAFFDEIKSSLEDLDLSDIADLAWFNRNFASLCAGVETVLLNQILKLYRNFSKEQLKKTNSQYDKLLLQEIIAKSETRSLHRDEQSLLLGVINNLMLSLRRLSHYKFEAMKHPFAHAYRNAVKYVICVDEASDYSILDYYCISSFLHYEISSITLCGDIMQGLGVNGITSWDSLREWVFPKVDIFTLKKSYRQWPSLLNVAKRMYKDDQGKEAPYDSAFESISSTVVPLAFISSDENAKIDWIAERIDEVYHPNEPLPSIAIFINEDVDSKTFVKKLNDHELLNAFYIDDCTQGYQGREDAIRVFHLSDVKGMEFEAAIFHDIDDSQIKNDALLRRYLYVGISRARTHLAATFKTSDSEVLKYFETNKTWRR